MAFILINHSGGFDIVNFSPRFKKQLIRKIILDKKKRRWNELKKKLVLLVVLTFIASILAVGCQNAAQRPLDPNQNNIQKQHHSRE